jgi:hypothetical protein
MSSPSIESGRPVSVETIADMTRNTTQEKKARAANNRLSLHRDGFEERVPLAAGRHVLEKFSVMQASKTGDTLFA